MLALKHTITAVVLLLAIVGSCAEFKTVGLKTYYIEREIKLTWRESWNYCASNNMSLFSIDTDLKKRLLEPILTGEEYWTSGNDLADPSSTKENRKFVWSNSGMPFTFTNWNFNEPNNINGRENCINTTKNTKWNDNTCTNKYYFICEY